MRDDYELPPIYVTENGAAFADHRSNGSVPDPQRASTWSATLRSIARAVEDERPVRGYFLWSLLDNFEWSLGYSQRFGIVYVDFETLERVPKTSYRWYRDSSPLIAAAQAHRRSDAPLAFPAWQSRSAWSSSSSCRTTACRSRRCAST